jgi:membrane-bound lytic murein transglycosylase MltF
MTDSVDRYDSLLKYYCGKYPELDWKIQKKQILLESWNPAKQDLDPRSVSPSGAKGLCQFMPGTWKEWGEGDPFNPEDAIRAKCKYMAYLYSRFEEIPDSNERYRMTLASYNTGLRNINKMLALGREACGLPLDFDLWVSSGRPEGDWQRWEYSSRFLRHVTGMSNSKETLGYVKEIFG